MESPHARPSSELMEKRDFVRLPFFIIYLASIAFAICFIGSDFLPTTLVSKFLFPEASFFKVQPPVEALALAVAFVSVVWCVIYFIVASISKRVWLSIALSSSIVGALRIAIMVTLDKYSPMGAPDFYVAIFNCVIGFIAGGFASLAVARYFHRRATAYPSNHEIT